MTEVKLATEQKHQALMSSLGWPSLIGCRLLDVVDDEDVDRTLHRCQLESELLL
jgi:hypothetical protein